MQSKQKGPFWRLRKNLGVRSTLRRSGATTHDFSTSWSLTLRGAEITLKLIISDIL